jgi:hypothetical protein
LQCDADHHAGVFEDRSHVGAVLAPVGNTSAARPSGSNPTVATSFVRPLKASSQDSLGRRFGSPRRRGTTLLPPIHFVLVSPHVAVMDADLQHDEALLPDMLDLLHNGSIDIVIGSRFLWWRRLLDAEASTQAQQVGQRLGTARDQGRSHRSRVFMLKQTAFCGRGPTAFSSRLQILVDILASSPRPLTCQELPFTFHARLHGESKLNPMVAVQYLELVLERPSIGLD